MGNPAGIISIRVDGLDQNGGLIVPKVQLNSPAPDFSLNDFSGQSVNLSDFRLKSHVLLVFNRGFA